MPSSGSSGSGLPAPLSYGYDDAGRLTKRVSTELTYEGGGTGEAGDNYKGLDRFGRLVETIWKSSSTESSTAATAATGQSPPIR